MMLALLFKCAFLFWCTRAKPILGSSKRASQPFTYNGPAYFGRSLTEQALLYPQLEVLYNEMNTTESDLLSFINSLDGTVTLRGQPQYDRVRNFTEPVNEYFNTILPFMIVSCLSENDVQETIAFAAARGLPLCARAGGHDSGGYSTCADGVVVDVAPMSQVNPIPARGVVVAQAGALWRDVYAALTPLGLAAVTGSCPTVGIAGFTLGGGWGPLSAEHGLGVDQVQAFRVALANGQVVEATANNTYSDLFWGLLGGGHGNFGVMTGITYNVFPLAEAATFNITWNIAGNATKAAQVLLVWQDTLLDKDPRGLSTWPHMYTNAFTGEQLLMIYATYAPRNMDIAAAEQVLQQAMQPLLALSPTASAFRRTPWSEMPALVAGLDDRVGAAATGVALWSAKRCEYVGRPLTLQEFEQLVGGILTTPAYPSSYEGPVLTYVEFETMEGAISDVAPGATAFSHRTPGFDAVVNAMFNSQMAGARDAAQAWLTGLYNQWTPLLSGGAYQNCPTEAYSPRSVALSKYYTTNLCRLVTVKAKYDPTNVFEYEQGVLPQMAGC